ncbi:MAG: TIGR00153 family protein [Planctomycetes bacterium]|nr:TIGR00153 family protein [Planctomycetota bacterium]
MSIFDKLFAESPFRALSDHARKVHECVELVRPIVQALFDGDYEKILKLQDLMSKTEYEADIIKTNIRNKLSAGLMLPVKKDDLSRYLAYQDDVADAAEDFAVVVSLRKTQIHPDVRDELQAFTEQVIQVSEKMLEMAETLVLVAQSGFAGQHAEAVIKGTERLGEEEWKADKLQRRFARHCYKIEDQLDPVTLMFYDKFCRTLSDIANKAENTGKFLHMLIVHR